MQFDEIVWITIVNGYGMGLMWVTLTTVTFSTPAPNFRVEGASLFALIRSIGASMGTSVIVAILVRSSQVNYIEMRNHINTFTESLNVLGMPPSWNLIRRRCGRIAKLVLAQAEMVAYLNAFVFPRSGGVFCDAFGLPVRRRRSRKQGNSSGLPVSPRSRNHP